MGFFGPPNFPISPGYFLGLISPVCADFSGIFGFLRAYMRAPAGAGQAGVPSRERARFLSCPGRPPGSWRRSNHLKFLLIC
jgi:hypothetical protein